MSDTTILPGARLGDFQILRKLGRGGMSNVYAVRDLRLGRDIAMKVLLDHLAMDQDYVRRFQREAHAAAKLNHPNIVQVFDVGTIGSQHYITQELVDGQNLRERIDASGRISPEEAFEVLLSVATALGHAAAAGITHRDIKPENVMRGIDGTIKVADFGLVHFSERVDDSRGSLTIAGLALGTPRYMSPEQVQGRPVDVRSDLYSLGVTIYHLLAGRPPFEGDDPLALAVMQLNETPPPLDRVRDPDGRDRGDDRLPAWMAATVAKLMDKAPDRRFQSADELLGVLHQRATVTAGQSEGVVVGGTAGMRIRLQRATDNAHRNRFGRYARRAAAVIAPVVLAGAAAVATFASTRKDVGALLNPAVVPKMESVESQFVHAHSRSDAAGWRAVAEYFPPGESMLNKTYATKSGIQAVRLLVRQERYDEASAMLRPLLADPTIKDVYQVVLIAEQCVIAEQRVIAGRVDAEEARRRARQTLRNKFVAVESSQPQRAAMLWDVLPAGPAAWLRAAISEPSPPSQ